MTARHALRNLPLLTVTQHWLSVTALLVGFALGLAAFPAQKASAAVAPQAEQVAAAELAAAVKLAAASARRAAPVGPRPVEPRPEPRLEDAGLRATRSHTRAFAGLEHLQLQLPRNARAIGFHESGTGHAVSLHPMGIPRVNANLPRINPAPVGEGFEYVVLGSRGRRNGPTSAVDISLPPNSTVHAPVTGTVVQANAYLLYGRVPDNVVHIVPDSRPDLVVVLMHVNGLLTTPGARVVADETPVATTARLLPFSSQIDRYVGRLPHVHMEVRRR